MPPVEPMEMEYTAERKRQEADWMAELRRDAALYEALNGLSPTPPPVTVAPPAVPGAPAVPAARSVGARPPGGEPGEGLVLTKEQIIARIRGEADRQGVSFPLALAVATQESYLNPNAVGDNGKSLGLFQLQPAAAIDAGIDPAKRGQLDENIRGGVRFIKLKLAQAGGSVPKALLRYNGGGDPNYVQNVYKHLKPGERPVDAAVAAEASGMMRAAQQRGASGSWQSGASGTWSAPVPPAPPKPAQIAAATGPRPPGLAFVDQGMPLPPGPLVREAGGLARGVLRATGSLLRTPANLVEAMVGPASERTEGRIAAELLLGPLTGPLEDLGQMAAQGAVALDFPERQKDFRDKLFEAAGSMATYWAPAIVSGGIASVGHATAAGLARWSLSGPAVAATIAESFQSANDAYEGLRPLVGVDEAATRAGKVLGLNVLLLGMTNAAGLGNQVQKPLLKILAGGIGEGGQEILQYATEQHQFWVPSTHASAPALKAQGWQEAEGRVFMPFNVKTAAEVGLIGAILGGGAGALNAGVVREAGAPVLRSLLDTMTSTDAGAALPHVRGWGAFRVGGEPERGGIPLPGGREPARARTLGERIADYDDLIAIGEAMGDPVDQLITQREALLQEQAAPPAPLPAAPDDMPQHASPPTLRPRTGRAPTFGEGATGLTPDTFRDDQGRWRIPLRDIPPEELELQDFIRQQGGIRLSTETDVPGELRALVTSKETGLYRLQNNTSGRSLQAMAEAAAEAGFPATADKTDFLDLMDRSIRQGQGVYSLNASGQVPLLDDPALATAYASLVDMAQTLEVRTVEQRRAEDGPRRRADVLTTAQEAVARGEYTTQDVRDLLPGMSLNDDESAKMMVVMGQLSDNLVDKLQAIVDAGPEQQDIHAERAMAQALTLIGELDPQRMGVLAEAGRSLGILNDPLSAYNQRLRFIHAALNRVGDMTPYRFAQKMLAFEHDRPTMLRVAKDMESAAEKETFLEQWVNGILEASLPDRELLGDPFFVDALRHLPLELTTPQRDLITPLLLTDAMIDRLPGLTIDEQARVAAVPQTAEGLRSALGEERFTGLVDELMLQSTPLQVSAWAPTLLEHLTPAQLDDVGRPLLATMRPGQITDLQARRPDIIRTLATGQSQGDLFTPGDSRPLTLLDWMSIPQLEALGTETLESMLPPGIREVELNNPQFQRLTRALGLMNAVRVLERRALAEMGGKLWEDFSPEQRSKVGAWILRVLPEDEAAAYGADVVAALEAFARPRQAETIGTRQATVRLRTLEQQLRADSPEAIEALRARLLQSAGPERWHRIAGDVLRLMSATQLRQFGPRIIGTMSTQDVESTPFYIFQAMDPQSFPLFLEKLYPTSPLNRRMPDAGFLSSTVSAWGRPQTELPPLLDRQDFPTNSLNRRMPDVADTLHLDTLGADIQTTLSPRQQRLLRATTQELLTRGQLTPDELGSLAPDVLRVLGTAQVRTLGRRLILTMNAFQVSAIHSSVVAQFALPDTPLPGMGLRAEEDPAGLRTVDEVEAEPQAQLPLLELLPEDDTQLQPALPGLPGPPRQPFKTQVGSLLLEQWIQGLLGPKTALINAASGGIVPVYRVLEEGMAGLISQIPGVGSGQIHPRVALAQIRAIGSGIAEGWELAGRAFRTSQEQFEKAYHLRDTHSAPTAEISRQPTTRSETFGIDPESAIGKAFDWWATWIGLANGGRTIFRTMLAADEFAKAVNFRMELAGLADSDAYQQGMTAEQAAAHQEWALRHPSADQMRQAAAQQTILNVFQQEITPERPIASVVGWFANINLSFMGVDLPIGRAIVPFPRASTNIPAFALERTPLGLVMHKTWEDIQAGGARRDRAIAKQTLGILTATALAKLAFEGMITGRGPEDYEMRRALEATGWRPYAAKIGNLMYVPLDRFDPLTTQLGLVADFVQVMRDDAIPEDALRVGAALAYSLSQNLANRTYMESMARFFTAISPRHMTSPASVWQGGIEWGRGMVSSFMPWPGTTVQRLRDPYARETRDLTDGIQHLLGRLYARSPGWAVRSSTELPLDRNRWAEPRLLGWGFGPNWMQALGSAFAPTIPSLIQDAPIDQELSRMRIQLTPSRPVLNVRAPTEDASAEAAFQADPSTAQLLRLTPQQQELREIYEAANMTELRKLPGSHRLYDADELTNLTTAVVRRLNTDNPFTNLPNATLPAGVTDLKDVLNWAVQQPQYQVLQSFEGPRGAKQGFLQYVDRLYKDAGERQFLLDQPALAHRVQTAKDYSQYWRTPAVRQPALREQQQDNARLRVGQ